MPIYEIHHSYPFTGEQKHALAQKITNLHATTFTTPSFFVHVVFTAHDASTGSYFVAGEARTTSTNRIQAQVRLSPTRPRSAFDTLATEIESAWYDVINGSPDEKNHDKRPGEVDESSNDKAEAQRLLMISFYPMITAREAGMTIPEAGKEGQFFREWKPYMVEMAGKGALGFEAMIRELEDREDLRALVA